MENNILIFGGSSNLTLNIIYCLKDLGYKLHVFSNYTKNAAKYSKFIADYKLALTPEWDIDELLNHIQVKQISTLLPVGETEVKFIIENRLRLEKKTKCMWTPSLNNFNTGIDKLKLAQLLNQHDIPVPAFFIAKNKLELKEICDRISFPVLIKPTTGSFGWGIKKFINWNNILAHYERYDLYSKAYIIQPFIVGSDISYNVLCNNGKIVCKTMQESPVKDGNKFSPGEILEFHNDKYVDDIVESMMHLLRWHGVACVNLRRNPVDNIAYVLEINGRFWGSLVSSFSKAKVNFPAIIISLINGENVEFPEQVNANQISLSQYFISKISLKNARFSDTKYFAFTEDLIARLMQMLEKFR